MVNKQPTKGRAIVKYLIVPSGVITRFRRGDIRPSEVAVCSAISTGLKFYNMGKRTGYRDVRDIAHISGLKVETARRTIARLRRNRFLIDNGKDAFVRWKFTFDERETDDVYKDIHLRIPINIALHKLTTDWTYKLCLGVVWNYQRLSESKRCYASNSTIGKVIGRSRWTVSRQVQIMVRARWLHVFIEQNGLHQTRYLTVNLKG